MAQETNRRLSPVQMEQFIIHLKSEIEKYKTKTEDYKRVSQKNQLDDLVSRNEELIRDVEWYKKQLSERDAENQLLQSRNEQLEKEYLTYQLMAQQLQTNFEQQLSGIQSLLDESRMKEEQSQLEQKKLEDELQTLKGQLTVQQDKQSSRTKSIPAIDEDEWNAITISPIRDKEMGIKPGKATTHHGFSHGIVSFKNKSYPTNHVNSLERFLQTNPLYQSPSASTRGTVDPFKKQH